MDKLHEIIDAQNKIITEQQEYIDNRSYIDQVYEHAILFTNEAKTQIVQRVKDLSDATLEMLIDYLEFYKSDFAIRSIKIFHSDIESSSRSGSIASIDTMMYLFYTQIKEKQFKDRIVWKISLTQNKKDLENPISNS